MIAWVLTSWAVAAPLEVPWQARLLGPSGAPLEGAHSVQILLFPGPTGTVARWSDTFAVDAQDGFVSVVLGAGQALTPDLFSQGDLWIEPRVDGQALGPRTRLGSTPRAVTAEAVRVEGAATSTTCPGEIGRVVFDTALGNLRVCNGTNWILIGVQTLVTVGNARRWSDGTLASSCAGYKNPPPGHLYQNE